MATVPRAATKIQHYAYFNDIYGTAELLNGTGYLFRADGERKATLVSYKDSELVLLGLVDMSDTQYEVDQLVGGPARIACDRAQEVR